MKKVLALVLMASIAQGSFLSGEYENLQEHLNDLKFTQRCLGNFQIWSRFSDQTITDACNFLEEEFIRVKKGENIVPQNSKNLDSYQQHKDLKKSLYAEQIAKILSIPGLHRDELFTRRFVGDVILQSQAYYNALKKASIDAKLRK